MVHSFHRWISGVVVAMLLLAVAPVSLRPVTAEIIAAFAPVASHPERPIAQTESTPEPEPAVEDRTVVIDLNGGASPGSEPGDAEGNAGRTTEGGGAAGGDGQIVFEATDTTTGNRHIYRIDAAEGAEPEDLTLALDSLGVVAPDDWIAISPDGEWLLIGTERFHPECAGWPCLAVVSADLSSSETVLIGELPLHPEGFGAISSGGDMIVYPAGGGPHTLDLWAITRLESGWSEPTLLTADSPYQFQHAAAISMDGTRIVFDCGDQPYGAEGTAICEVGTDGSGFRVVATPEETSAGDLPGVALHHPDYEPDGGIVFQSGGTGTLWRIGPDAEQPEPISETLVNDSSPCVLADGRVASLWFGREGNDSGMYDVKVMTPDGGEYAVILSGMSVEDIGCGG